MDTGERVTGVIIRNALPFDGNVGGILEYFVPNPQQHIDLISDFAVPPGLISRIPLMAP